MSETPFHAFGLQIEDDYIRLALFSPRTQHPRLLALDAIEMEPGAITDGRIVAKESVKKKISEILQRNASHRLPKYCVFTIPDAGTYLFTLDLPSNTPADRDAVLPEVGLHLPLPLNEAVVDVTTVATEHETTTIQVVACEKTVLDATLHVLDDLRVETVGALPSSLAALHALTVGETPTVVVLTGARSTTLAVVTHRGIPFTATTEAMSLGRVTSLLMQQLRLNESEAHESLTVCGFDATISHGVVRKVLENELTELTRGITTIFSFLHEHTANETPVIILAGPTGHIRQFDRELAHIFQAPVNVNPVRPDILRSLHGGMASTSIFTSSLPAIGAALSTL